MEFFLAPTVWAKIRLHLCPGLRFTLGVSNVKLIDGLVDLVCTALDGTP